MLLSNICVTDVLVGGGAFFVTNMWVSQGREARSLSRSSLMDISAELDLADRSTAERNTGDQTTAVG